jgi:hypothetical protein
MPRPKKPTGRFNDNLERLYCEYITEQYDIASRDQQGMDEDFASVIDMLECRRTEKDYEWMSDVFLPEYPSIYLTEAAQWANQYFQSREFVDVFLEGTDPESKTRAMVAKKYINTMLNSRELFHFQKYMRARSINSTRGMVTVICGWNQVTKPKTITQPMMSPVMDFNGEVMLDAQGEPMLETQEKTIMDEDIILDHFDYHVPDPRNVVMSSEYCYSIQQKEWVIIRSELSWNQLKEMEDRNAFFNLELVKKMETDEATDTAKQTREDANRPKAKIAVKYFDVYERFGKVWAKVDEKDEEGYPIKMSPGLKEDGTIKEEAEFLEAIVTVVRSGSKSVLIRFQPTPFRSSLNISYRPLIRGLLYIHPTKDVGLSDGMYAKDRKSVV